MTELYKTILQKFKANGSILFSNKTFYFNGLNNYDDILSKGNLNKKSKTVSILYKQKQKDEIINTNAKELNNLIQKNESLSDVGAIVGIFIDKQTIKDIQNVIKRRVSTFLRIFNDEKNIKISILDYR